jgi:hypothetical protein
VGIPARDIWTLLLLAFGGVAAVTNAPTVTESVNASVTSTPKTIFGPFNSLFNFLSLLSLFYDLYLPDKEHDCSYALSLPLTCIFFLINQF